MRSLAPEAATAVPKMLRTMKDAARNVSSCLLSDGPMQTEGIQDRIIGRVDQPMFLGPIKDARRSSTLPGSGSSGCM